MKIHIDISEEYEDTFITIHAKEWSEELDHLVKTIKGTKPKRIIGTNAEQSILLDPDHIEYVFAENRKIFAMTRGQKVELKMKLYEVEMLLEPHQFTRFSKSVIGNIKQISHFELSFNGNLCVYFKSGNKEYVSRKYVSSLKEKIILGSESSEG